MKNLSCVSEKEQKDFINSFDHVLCDMDGVIWLFWNPIEKAFECIELLKKLGKKFAYVSNNSLKSIDDLRESLSIGGFDNNDIIFTPISAIINHLKSINFDSDKEIFVIGFPSIIDELEKNGYKVPEKDFPEIELSVSIFLNRLLDKTVKRNVGAVIVDFDINVSYYKIQKAIIYLQNKDVVFICGARDKLIPFGLSIPLLGAEFHQRVIEEITGREAITIAKPSLHYNKYIVEKIGIKDPRRVLFIGDSISQDMQFATNCGYQKLLVLSGVTKQKQLENWPNEQESSKPQYYVESLKEFYEIINKNFN